MTDQEITLRIVRQELGKMLKHYQDINYTDSEVLETIVDRVIDLTSFIDNQIELPPVYAPAWENDDDE